MKKAEFGLMVVLLLVSSIYSVVLPETSVEEIEITKEITVYVEGALEQTLVFDENPTIKTVLDKCNLGNEFGFDETIVLDSEEYLYIPTGENLISLNQANQNDFENISGIGPVTAQKIVAYQQETGFGRIEDIMNVSGIGEKTYLKYRQYFTL